jgi:diadenosine tetraphosphate (Ap4A) HIT family hydrolase
MCKYCDYDGEVLWENERVFVKQGRPHHKGHIQIVLKEHHEDIMELDENLAKEFFYDMVRVAKVVQEVLKPDKMNYFLYGNWVAHLHWHIVPRFKQDEDFGNPPSIPRKMDEYEKRELTRKEIEKLKSKLKSLT